MAKKTQKNKTLKEQPKKPIGRPSSYTKELGQKICREISSSTDSLEQICQRNSEFPTKKCIWEWRIDFPEFGCMYAEAKRNQADLLAEEIKEISDDSRGDIKLNSQGDEVCDTEYVARSRLRVDTRKWIACKLLPKVYGDQKTIEEVTNENNALKEEMRLLREQLNEKHKKDY